MPVKRIKKQTKLSQKTEEALILDSVKTYSIVDRLKQPKNYIPLTIIVLLILGFLFRGLFVAALVNGEPIARLAVISELEKQGGKQALSSLVNQALILQEARKKKVVVAQSETDAALKQIEDSLKSQGQNLDTALAMQGMTRQDLMTQLKLRTLVEKLLADKIKVTDAEVADYIVKNRANFPAEMTEEELKKSVTEQLKQQKLGSESQAWLQELNKNAKINYFVNY